MQIYNKVLNEFYKDSMGCLIWNLQVNDVIRKVR